ncbi:hypothetical protein [Brachyspira murdochii]|uniref:hypothetical protein n=1 Tax=Brachyspira murdochii TaxID=84378 RepID=UPI003005560A
MSEFKLTYKLGNFEMELKGEEGDFIKTFDDFQNNYLPKLISSELLLKGKKSKKSKMLNKTDSSVNKSKNKESKTSNKDYSLVELGINNDKMGEWKEFYNEISTDEKSAIEKIAILLYWIKHKSNIEFSLKIDKNVIYSFLYNTGKKVDFNVKDALSNAKREGRVYIKSTPEGYEITHNGEELVNGFISNK